MGVRKPVEPPKCDPSHTHGTYCYHAHGCRCQSCRAANSNATNKASRKRTIRARNMDLLIRSRGAQRRLQALAVMGWGAVEIANRTGLTQNNLREIRAGVRPGCRARTHALISREYDLLWDKPATGRTASITRAVARRNGYVGPLHWDDIDSDTGPIDGLLDV